MQGRSTGDGGALPTLDCSWMMQRWSSSVEDLCIGNSTYVGKRYARNSPFEDFQSCLHSCDYAGPVSAKLVSAML
eukprot:3794666-Amphidinium_carterae.1